MSGLSAPAQAAPGATVDLNATVVEGNYDVTAELSHTTGAGGDVPVELSVGEETLSKNVSLETNQTVTVTFESVTTSLAPGRDNLTMSGSTDAASGSLTLSMDDGDGDDGPTGGDGDDGPTGGDGDDGTTGGDGDDGTTGGDSDGNNNATGDSSDGSGPGFGLGVVVTGLGGAGYLLRRRRSPDETGSS